MSTITSEMYVIKRDGSREPVSFDKVLERCRKAAAGLSVNYTRLAQLVLAEIHDEVRTMDLDEIAARLSISYMTTHPDWATLAAQIIISNCQRSAPNSFSEAMEILAGNVDSRGAPAPALAADVIAFIRSNAAALDAMVVPENDFLLDYFGFKTLEKAYLLRSAGRVIETPQYMWLRVAVGLWGSSHDGSEIPLADRLERIRLTYTLMSQKAFTHATPTLFNAGTPRPQCSSCFAEGTLVHTMNGVKAIEHVEIGDEVVTHTGAVKRVAQLHKNPLADRKLYNIKVAGSPAIAVTENHRLMSLSDEQGGWGHKPTWNRVDYLRTGDWIAIPKKKGGAEYILDVKTILDDVTTDGDNITYLYEYDETTVYPFRKYMLHKKHAGDVECVKPGAPFNRYWKFDTEAMELLGIWFGDGSICNAKNSTGNRVPRNINIVSYHNNTTLIDFVVPAVKKFLGVEHVTVSHDKHGMVAMTVNHTIISHIFKRLFNCGFDKKRLPAFFNTMSYDHIRAFLCGLVSSDGCVARRGAVCVCLTNPPLVQDIYHLARSVSIPITLTMMSSASGKSTGRMSIPYEIVCGNVKKYYADDRLSTVTKKWVQTREIDGVTFMRLNGKEISAEVPEYVYTLGVEDDHSYSVGGIVAENCFLLSAKADSIEGIFDTLKECALISKHAGGIGLHVHNIRAQGTPIAGTQGISNGLVPMLRVFNNTARYVDQCFAPDTLIMTRTGEKHIADIEPGDEVLTSGCKESIEEGVKHYVHSTAGPTWCRVSKRVTHLYSGTMYRIKTTLMGDSDPAIEVSEEHPFLIQKGNGYDNDYVEAKNLTVGDYMFSPSPSDVGKTLDMHVKWWPVSAVREIESHNVENVILYDLEVEGTHDYTVAGAGIAHNGGGKRNGSFAIYLEPWHADIQQFLKMKSNTGSEEERARDLFYALWIPDLFMRRVESGGDWSLFCPHEAPGLADVHGAAFVELYERYEREGRARRSIPAQKLWSEILVSQIETGTPYLLYKDAANAKSNQQNLGTIKSSNLCVAPETKILTRNGIYPIEFLCNKEVEVWNGDQWSRTTILQTGSNQKLMRVRVLLKKTPSEGYSNDGLWEHREIRCTPYHKFILPDNSRVDAHDLKEGMELISWTNEVGQVITQQVLDIAEDADADDTYCFNEPINHAGVFNGILTGNCTEIIEYSSPEETAVCNLASIALPFFVAADNCSFDFTRLREVTSIVVRNLNRVIDINYYPTPETRRSNMRHRPIGLGVQGLADVFARLGLAWETPAAAALNQEIFENIYYAALTASVDLARIEGPYETFVGSPAAAGKIQPDLWGLDPAAYKSAAYLDWAALRTQIQATGLRNSLLVAPMPTASTSQILGYNECIEPFTTNIYVRRTLAGEFTVINKYLIADLMAAGLWSPELKDRIVAANGSIQAITEIPTALKERYKTVWEIKQKTLIDMAADRGAFICQSQSLNLFVADPTIAKLSSMHFYAWKRGLKTGIYYLRTKSAVQAIKFTIDPRLAAGGSSARLAEVAAAVSGGAGAEPAECLLCSA